MQPQVVKLPNGQLYTIDDTTPSEVLDELEGLLAEQQPPEGELLRGLKLGGSGLVRGAGQTLGMLADLGQTATGGMQSMAGAREGFDTGSWNRDIQDFGTQPREDNAIDESIDAVSEGIGSAVAVPIPFTKPVQAAEAGALAGLGGMIGGNTMGKDGIGPAVGALLGGGVAGLRQYFSGNKSNNLRDLARFITDQSTPDELMAAARAFDEAQMAGVNITLDQALQGKNKAAAWAGSALSDSPVAPQTQGVLANQPGQVVSGMERNIATLRGEAGTPQQAFNQARKTAVQDYKGFVGRQGAQFTRRAEDQQKAVLMDDELDRVRATLDDVATRNPVLRGEADRISRLLNNKDITTVEQLDRILKTEASQISKGTNLPGGMDAGNAKLLGSELSDIRKSVNEFYAPKYAEANLRFSTGQAPARSLLKQSPMARIRGGKNDPDTEAGGALFRIFSAGSNPNAKVSEIRFIAKRMNRVNPEAFRNGVTTYLSDILARSTVRQGDRLDPVTIKNVNQALFGTTNKVQGLKDMLYGVAQGHNMKNPADAYNGFVNFMQTVNRMYKQVPGSGATAIEGAATAQKSTIGTLARFPYLGNFAGWADGFYGRNTMKELDKLFSSREGLKTLQQLAREPTGSPRAQSIIRGWVVGQTQQAEQTEE